MLQEIPHPIMWLHVKLRFYGSRKLPNRDVGDLESRTYRYTARQSPPASQNPDYDYIPASTRSSQWREIQDVFVMVFFHASYGTYFLKSSFSKVDQHNMCVSYMCIILLLSATVCVCALACACMSVGSMRKQTRSSLQRLPLEQAHSRELSSASVPQDKLELFSSRPWKAIRAQPSPLDLPPPLITELSSGRSTGKGCLRWAAAGTSQPWCRAGVTLLSASSPNTSSAGRRLIGWDRPRASTL